MKDLHAKMMSERSFDMHKITQDYNQKDAQEWLNKGTAAPAKIDHSTAEVGAKQPPFAMKKVRFLHSRKHRVFDGAAVSTGAGRIQRATRRIEICVHMYTIRMSNWICHSAAIRRNDPRRSSQGPCHCQIGTRIYCTRSRAHASIPHECPPRRRLW